MKFDFQFSVLGLPWPFDIEINVRQGDLVLAAISQSNGSKMAAIKYLRNTSPHYLGLVEAKNMIEEKW